MAHNLLRGVVRHKIGEVDKDDQAEILCNVRVLCVIENV